MTTITRTDNGNELSRVINVTRLHFATKFRLLVLPVMILAFIFFINYLIWWMIFGVAGMEGAASASQGMQFSGASAFIFIYMMIVAVQAVNLTFPFALGYSVTRRDFSLGTSLTFVLLALYYSAIMTVMAELEKATEGWGLGGHMFDVVYFGAENPFQRFTMFLLIFLFFLFIGSASASVYVRWKSNGMLVFSATLTLIVIGLVALVTLTGNWPLVGEWFVANGAIGVACWSLVPTAIAALAGYLLLRRATPKN